jgi:hypothetical protein
MGLASFLLPKFIWCRVCGLHLESCSAARAIPEADRAEWLASLEACPSCGNDGYATSSSRVRWLSSGSQAESPYWSWTRMGMALLLGALVLGGFLLIAGRYRVRL